MPVKKDPESVVDLPQWFDPRRFILVDSNVHADVRSALGYGLFTFESAIDSEMRVGEEQPTPGATLQGGTPPPPPPAAQLPPPRSGDSERHFGARYLWCGLG